MKKVLILGVASVQMDALNELENLGIKTYACAAEKDGPGAESASVFVEIDFSDIKKVIEYIKSNDIDAVYSVGSDLAIPIVSHISEILYMPHFVSSNTAHICNNKLLMRETLGRSFRGNVSYQGIFSKEIIPKLEYPFILKPTDSQGQRGVYLIESYQEYLDHFDEVKNYSRDEQVITEKYVTGKEISVNGYMVDGNLELMFISERVTWPEYTGLIHKHILASDIVSEEVETRIKDIVLRTAKKLAINNGPIYLQMKIEDEVPYIIEVTPRLDGCHMWKLIKERHGINLMKLTLQHLLENNTEELNNFLDNNESYELEFMCEKPGGFLEKSKFEIPRNVLDYYFYYQDGEIIRSINSKFEKIGYWICKKEKY